MDRQLVLIFDFGGLNTKLMAREIRELNVYSEIVPNRIKYEEVLKKNPEAIIFAGTNSSIYDDNAPTVDKRIYDLAIPILAISYGSQLLVKDFSGLVEKSINRKYKHTKLLDICNSSLFDGVAKDSDILLDSHDQIKRVPESFSVIAKTDDGEILAIANREKKFYGLQFDPQSNNNEVWKTIIANFLFGIAKLEDNWDLSSFIQRQIENIRKKVGDKRVICGLSGGVDSSVAASLVHRAIGDQLTCIFVNHGLLRKNEAEQVIETFSKKLGIKLIYADERSRFLEKLENVVDPETKRKIIGEEFIRVFEEKAKEAGDAQFLVQGTIYPDVVESGGEEASLVKSHHNVGGLPKDMKFELIEPLRELFKDEVRKVGLKLGLDKELIERHPFPGPGLAIRIIGEVTYNKIRVLQEADFIFREEIKAAGLYQSIWQAFAVLPGVRSVGFEGNERTYTDLVALRAVSSKDAMTAKWSRIPYETLERISSRITNEVEGINRVVYDISNKPPATIEWE